MVETGDPPSSCASRRLATRDASVARTAVTGKIVPGPGPSHQPQHLITDAGHGAGVGRPAAQLLFLHSVRLVSPTPPIQLIGRLPPSAMMVAPVT